MYLIKHPHKIHEEQVVEGDTRLKDNNVTSRTEYGMMCNGDLPLPWPEIVLGFTVMLLLTGALVGFLLWMI